MNKLTKIIAENKKWNEYFEEHHGEDTLVKLEPVNRTIKYLLSLLEEKDKALAFYADIENWENGYMRYDADGEIKGIESYVEDDSGDIARKALNTSSNNEGE